jgi:hypothetical protein
MEKLQSVQAVPSIPFRTIPFSVLVIVNMKSTRLESLSEEMLFNSIIPYSSIASGVLLLMLNAKSIQALPSKFCI